MASDDDDFQPDKYTTRAFDLVVKIKPKFKPPQTNIQKKAPCFKMPDNKYLTKKKDDGFKAPMPKKAFPATNKDDNYQ